MFGGGHGTMINNIFEKQKQILSGRMIDQRDLSHSKDESNQMSWGWKNRCHDQLFSYTWHIEHTNIHH